MNDYFSLGRTDHGLAFARAYINPADSEISKYAGCPDGSVIYSITERTETILNLDSFGIDFSKSIYIISSNCFGIACFIGYTAIDRKERLIAYPDTNILRKINKGTINRIRMIGSSVTCYNTNRGENIKGTITANHTPIVA